MDDGGGGRGGGAAADSKAAAPRPTISLPPRSTFESLFRGGADVSPGPMTLVSSFFNDDPDADCRSFSQLLAGAMASPMAAAAAQQHKPPLPPTHPSSGDQAKRGIVSEARPATLVVSSSQPQPQSPFFMVPSGLSPGGLLESPAMFSSPNLGPFGMSHQQALAQVTAQAVHSYSHMHCQAEHPSSYSEQTAPSINMMAKDNPFESENTPHYNQRPQPQAITVDKPVDDGYNWRKYGQKQVKGSEFPRSYYKCTHPNCRVTKKVERSLEGQVTEIIYKGQHNHQPPANRRSKGGGFSSNGANDLSGGNVDYADNSEIVSQGGNYSRSSEVMTSKRERESGYGTSEQLSGSSDGDEVGNADLGQNVVDSEPDPKKRVVDSKVTESTSSHRTVTEPRIIVQTTSEVDLLDDGYRWRKYGQKVVKGNPHPRSYYKCTYAGCNVRKHVERASTDQRAVITTYEGKHNHDVPAARNSSHNTASSSGSANIMHPKAYNPNPHNQAAFKREQDGRNSVQQPVALLQLKEEHTMP